MTTQSEEEKKRLREFYERQIYGVPSVTPVSPTPLPKPRQATDVVPDPRPIQLGLPPGSPLDERPSGRAREEQLQRDWLSPIPPPVSTAFREFISPVEPGLAAWERFVRGVVEPGAALMTETAQKGVPGEQEIERKAREFREKGMGPLASVTKAYRESDLPAIRMTIDNPLTGKPMVIPLPFGKTLSEIDIGVKGAVELAADPVNLLFAGLTGAARRAASAGARALAVPGYAPKTVLSEAARRRAIGEIPPRGAVPPAKEPWQMTRAEFRQPLGRQAETETYIRSNTGAGTPQELLDYYKVKYPELRGVTIGELKATKESGPLANEGAARLVFDQGQFNPNASQIHLTKDAELVVTRHEIEHLLDAIHKVPVEEGRFGRYAHGEFNASDYLHRSQVRDAFAEGKAVPDEVLRDYPDIVPPAAGARALGVPGYAPKGEIPPRGAVPPAVAPPPVAPAVARPPVAPAVAPPPVPPTAPRGVVPGGPAPRPGGITPRTSGGLTGGLEVWVDPKLTDLPFEEFMPGGSVFKQRIKISQFNPLVRREIGALTEWPRQSHNFVAAHEEAHAILGVSANRSSQGVQGYNRVIRRLIERAEEIVSPGRKPISEGYAEAGQRIYEDSFVNAATRHSQAPAVASGPFHLGVTDLTEAWADAYALSRTRPDLFRSLFPSEYKAFTKSLDELPSPNLREVDTRMKFIPYETELPTREVLPGEQLPRFGTVPPAAPRAVVPGGPAPRVAEVVPTTQVVREAPGAPADLAKTMDDLSAELADVSGKIEAREGARIERPSWAVGVSDQQLENLARHEGLNPYAPDWYDGIDRKLIKEVRSKSGPFKAPGADTITHLRSQRTAIRKEIKDVNRQLEEVAVAKKRLQIEVARAAKEPITGSATTKGLATFEKAGRRKRGQPRGGDMGTPPPKSPDVVLDDELDLPTWETPEQGIKRKWDGARAVAGLELEEWTTQGVARLKAAGLVPDAETMRPLFEALDTRSPGALSASLRGIYDDLILMAKQEERETLEFLRGAMDESLLAFDAQNLVSRILASPRYFPHLWDRPKGFGVPRGAAGVQPSFTYPRVDQTFVELLDLGWAPVTWDPYAMMARRRLSRINYQEGVRFLTRLRQRQLAVLKDELTPEMVKLGWRVPEAGPAFEGRPVPLDAAISGAEGKGWTGQIAVPKDLANFAEEVWGQGSLQSIDKWTNALKRTKLLGSFFQHFDFATRALGVAFTPTGIMRGAPLKFPSLMARLMQVQWSPGARNTLRRELLSNKRIYKDYPLTWRDLIAEGWGVQGDISLIQREFTAFLRSPEVSGGIPSRVAQKLGAMVTYFESGLFDGWYRESQRWALENFIIPWVRRTRPDATPIQVAAEAAEAVNLMFSTLGNWQTVLRNPNLKKNARRTLFSINEQESMLRSSARALSLPAGVGLPTKLQTHNAGMFREFYLGIFLGLAAIGNVINLTATGKPMPPEAYNPIRLNDPYAPFFGVGYNNRFLSPQMPWVRGRNDQPVYLDLVGQMDTAFRWALSPVEALASRLNVFPRAIINQLRGESFFGESLDTWQERAIQALMDVAVPIGTMGAIQAARDRSPRLQALIPEHEGRLGWAGNLIQALGLNLTGESTGKMLDAASQAVYRRPYESLEPFQKDAVREAEPVADELRQRQRAGISRGDEGSLYFGALTQIDNDYTAQLAGAVALVLSGEEQRGFLSQEYSRAGARMRARKEQAAKDFNWEFAEADLDDPDPNKRALAQYYALFDKATKDQNFRPGMFSELVSKLELKLTKQQKEYIWRQTNRRDVPPEMLGLLHPLTQTRIRRSMEARKLVELSPDQRRKSVREAADISERQELGIVSTPQPIQPMQPIQPNQEIFQALPR